MERDFLCAIGKKEKGTTAAVEGENTRTEPDCPAMQWQFPAAPAFVSFRTARGEEEEEEGAKEFSISGFRPPAVGDAFDGIKKHAASPVVTSQQSVHLLGGSRMVQPLSSRHPVPHFNQANPMLRSQSLHNASGSLFKSQPFAISNGFGGSTVGAYGARNQRSQNSTQLTIFYNGTVNVFDNVSVQKAQELMLLASKASISSIVRKRDSPVSAPANINMPEVVPARKNVTQKQEPSVCHLAPVSSPTSIVPQSVPLPRATSNCTTDFTRPTTVVQQPVVVPASQASSTTQPKPLTPTSAAAVMPTAVPQARKASLARFLEKRKERVTSAEPYPTSKSPLESSESSFDIAPRSNNDKEPLHFGQPRNISFSSEV